MRALATRVGNGRRGIFLYGYYGARNLGDDLLLVAAIDILRAAFPGRRIFVRDHGDTQGLEDVGAMVTFTGIETILSDSRSNKFLRFVRYLGAYFGILRRCERIVFGGGTLFHEMGTIRPLVLQWLICLIGRACGAHIAALGVGVSDLRSASARWLLRRIVRTCDLFLVRDDAAVAQCAAAGVTVERTGDLVFNLEPIERPAAPNAVGLTVAPASYRSKEARERALTELTEGVRQWHAQGRRVVFLVFQRAGITSGDEPFLVALSERLPGIAIDVRTLVPEHRVLNLAFGDLAVVCGMRFHSLVLAAMAGVPFVGLAHDNKIEDICRRFDMPVLSAFAFTHQELAAAVAGVAAKRPDPVVLAECVAGAAANASLLRRIASR